MRAIKVPDPLERAAIHGLSVVGVGIVELPGEEGQRASLTVSPDPWGTLPAFGLNDPKIVYCLWFSEHPARVMGIARGVIESTRKIVGVDCSPERLRRLLDRAVAAQDGPPISVVEHDLMLQRASACVETISKEFDERLPPDEQRQRYQEWKASVPLPTPDASYPSFKRWRKIVLEAVVRERVQQLLQSTAGETPN